MGNGLELHSARELILSHMRIHHAIHSKAENCYIIWQIYQGAALQTYEHELCPVSS